MAMNLKKMVIKGLVVKEGMVDRYLFDGGYVKATVVNPTTYTFEFYYYNKDHLGNNREVVDSAGVVRQVTSYYPFGTPYTDPAAVMNANMQPYKYNGKELDRMHGLDAYDFGARMYFADRIQWGTMDPLCEKYYDVSPYGYCLNRPVDAFDSDGMEPIYNVNGIYLGSTSEGFTGEVLIYDGSEQIDFANFTKDELFKRYGAFDNFDVKKRMDKYFGGLSHDAISRIWTHIASQFNGMNVYDLSFNISTIEGGTIYYEAMDEGSWVTHYSVNGKGKSTIAGSGNYDYETTVENVASSIIVHEWYSHDQKKTSDTYKSHRLAYKNVINFKKLWDKTTIKYKEFTLKQLAWYTKQETGRPHIDPIYRRLYNKYVGK